MAAQNFKNHVRYYTPHHFVFYPIMLILIAISVYFSFTERSNRNIWIFISLIFASIISLSLLLRQHYALILQDRIIRLELRQRYYALTQQNFEPIEKFLSKEKLFALRFASDKEFIKLLNSAIENNLSSKQIKSEIKIWKADDWRV